VNGGGLVHPLAHEQDHRPQACADDPARHGRPNAERERAQKAPDGGGSHAIARAADAEVIACDRRGGACSFFYELLDNISQASRAATTNACRIVVENR